VEELPELMVPDAGAWRSWLLEHHTRPTGVWLVLAKKATVVPTSVTYDQALDEALCFGWIDGTLGRRDEATYRQRFTPRRPGSAWSRRNVGLVERLERAGRMHPSGSAAVEQARADGRWERAYAGQAAMEVPDDLAAALGAEPRAAALFAVLTKANRYSVLYRIETAKRPETRARRVTEAVAMLARGETPHPQKRRPGR
jgi:uncharacterized protein YdeI (YjbR/CyaY-like superfamily)